MTLVSQNDQKFEAFQYTAETHKLPAWAGTIIGANDRRAEIRAPSGAIIFLQNNAWLRREQVGDPSFFDNGQFRRQHEIEDGDVPEDLYPQPKEDAAVPQNRPLASQGMRTTTMADGLDVRASSDPRTVATPADERIISAGPAEPALSNPQTDSKMQPYVDAGQTGPLSAQSRGVVETIIDNQFTGEKTGPKGEFQGGDGGAKNEAGPPSDGKGNEAGGDEDQSKTAAAPGGGTSATPKTTVTLVDNAGEGKPLVVAGKKK